MGVWQRSPAGIALTNDDLRVSFDAALPDWQPYDVVGSPYCVRGYVIDDHFGGRSVLAGARQPGGWTVVGSALSTGLAACRWSRSTRTNVGGPSVSLSAELG
jgi:hypothetical protein